MGQGTRSFFVDLVIIDAKSGDGGPGICHFRREKYVPRGGPDGGDGGDGGDVILRGSVSLRTLLDFKYKRHYEAKNGKKGGHAERKGRKGQNLVLKVPLGTVAYDHEKGEVLGEVLEHGEELTLLKGGKGGRGNARFATSTRRAPSQFEEGQPGPRATIQMELKLLADVGIIGFPNAGKTSLLKALSGASAKIDFYPFTTLTPNLGVMKDPNHESFVVVDIPGIIEGASMGKGMGLAFLRHIERTRLLIFLLDASGSDVSGEYHTLKRELSLYNPDILCKGMIIVLNKIDLVSEELEFEPEDPEKARIFKVSALRGTGIEDLKGGIEEWLGRTLQSEP